MRSVFAILCAAAAVTAMPLVAAQDGPKHEKSKPEPNLSPELALLKQEAESWPTDRLRQAIAIEKKAIAEWARKNNFDPPGDRYDGDKNRVARRGGRGLRVHIGKRQQAQLMAQFQPRKARIEVMELVLRERENPRKETAAKKQQ